MIQGVSEPFGGYEKLSHPSKLRKSMREFSEKHERVRGSGTDESKAGRGSRKTL